MRVIVCGGSHYEDWSFVVNILDRVHARSPVTLLIEGGATELDSLARRWALARGIESATYPADAERYQHRAVAVRNARMLREGRPELVVAFEGGRTTEHMIAIAAGALVPVLKTWRLKEDRANFRVE